MGVIGEILVNIISSAIVGLIVGFWQHKKIANLRKRLAAAATRRLPAPTFGGPALELPRRAIVFTVGGQKDTILFCLERQPVEQVGFLCTGLTHSVARDILHEPAGRRYAGEEDHKILECNPGDIEDIRATTRALFQWLERCGVPPAETVLDPTGGLTTISVGAYTVAEELGIDSQYVRSDYDQNNRRIEGSQRLELLAHHPNSPATPPPSIPAPSPAPDPAPPTAILPP